jgi:hypothetical protein
MEEGMVLGMLVLDSMALEDRVLGSKDPCHSSKKPA